MFNVVTVHGCVNTTAFIEVHIFAPGMECDGRPVMINLSWVEWIEVNGTHATIRMAYSDPEGNYQDYINTTESYEELKGMIWR